MAAKEVAQESANTEAILNTPSIVFSRKSDISSPSEGG
jgi:hypothetical protein